MNFYGAFSVEFSALFKAQNLPLFQKFGRRQFCIYGHMDKILIYQQILELKLLIKDSGLVLFFKNLAAEHRVLICKIVTGQILGPALENPILFLKNLPFSKTLFKPKT